jgi:hypothetical protein
VIDMRLTRVFVILAASAAMPGALAQTAPAQTQVPPAIAPAPSPGEPAQAVPVVTPPAAATPTPPAAAQAPAAGAADTAATAAATPSGPANLCAELVTFLTPKPPEPAAAPAAAAAPAQPAQPAAAGQPAPAAPAVAAAPAPGDAQAPVQEGALNSEPQPTATDGETVAEEAEGGSAQDSSNQAGAAVEAPQDGNAPVAPGSGQNAPQTSGLSAPIPAAPEVTKKAPTMTLDEGQALADANDVAGCQQAARSMRREGVDMPPALIALAALDIQYQQMAAPEAPATQATPGGNQ